MKNTTDVNINLIREKDLSADAVIAYVASKLVKTDEEDDFSYFSFSDIYRCVYGYKNVRRCDYDAMIKGIKELADKDVFKEYEELDLKGYVVTYDESAPTMKSYKVNITRDDLNCIMTSSYKKRKDAFRYYLFMLSLREKATGMSKKYRNIVLTESLQYLSQMTKYAISSIQAYNKFLVDCGIIYCFEKVRPNEYVQYKKGNAYCRMCDIKLAREYLEYNGCFLSDKDKMAVAGLPDMESLRESEEFKEAKQIYDNLKRRSKVPSLTELRNSYWMIRKYNESTHKWNDYYENNGLKDRVKIIDEACYERYMEDILDKNRTEYSRNYDDTKFHYFEGMS